MRLSRPRHRNVILSALLALVLPLSAVVLGTGTASAAFDPSGFDFWVDSPAMGPIKSRVFRAADGNTDRVVYALDGMRAQQDLSGWEINTEVAREMTKWNINVVMPIGGQSSFYLDWNAPSSFLGMAPSGSASGSSSGSSSGSGATQVFSGGPGKSYRYDWETFLTRDLRNALRGRLGFRADRNGVFGLSMGGSAALTLAAYHPDQFSFAGSFSGYLNISAPGMREAIRVAMVDAGGYNVDSMAPPWDPKWLRMDPFVFAPRLIQNNTRLWISAASGRPTATDGPNIDTLNGMGLEALAWVNTRAFQVRMMSLGAKNATYDFPAFGIHAWNNWQDEAFRMLPDLSANIG
ncbi:alpha/beta hydrolase [Nocardia transvalensis]|uniref:alpha/beta hydrolase n=1 Tax=Nocardia transvalensis TaxID=37333 RepID=UPI001894D05B|nr:alpha/beta hydrolase family protein [Nocardia transvalensis]MBF6332493.1 esterase family protein [Nocardia transvalensis]